jgi:hypothetical protein
VPIAARQVRISIQQLARALASRAGRRRLALLTFYCDESYDSDPHQDQQWILDKTKLAYVPKTFVACGFIAHANTWGRIERRWDRANDFFRVKRFHAVHVNARSGEFEGWSRPKRDRYSKRLLTIIADQEKHLHVVSCGMFVRDYQQIIPEIDRVKFGHPYIVCFKTCVGMIAQQLELGGFAPDDKFSVILDRNNWENEAVEVFYKMKDSEDWPYHGRLATCTPGSSDEITTLQSADLIAYETFRLLHSRHRGPEQVRKSLSMMFPKNGFYGVYYERDTLEEIREPLRQSACVPNGFIVNFPPPEGGIARSRYAVPVMR